MSDEVPEPNWDELLPAINWDEVIASELNQAEAERQTMIVFARVTAILRAQGLEWVPAGEEIAGQSFGEWSLECDLDDTIDPATHEKLLVLGRVIEAADIARLQTDKGATREKQTAQLAILDSEELTPQERLLLMAILDLSLIHI